MAPRSLAQLIGAAPHVSTNYILALALFAAVALTASQFHLSFSPDPNPQQVHLTHSLTHSRQNASSGAGEVSLESRSRNSIEPRMCWTKKGRERERERERGTCLARAALAPGWTLAVPYIKPTQYLDCSRSRRRRPSLRCFHGKTGKTAETRPLDVR